ncbi:MAG TPA: hypothetical protein VK957_22910, partial [Lunatimonas sp.]|nr:hypothetical protein [Lunatimonas sp.]
MLSSKTNLIRNIKMRSLIDVDQKKSEENGSDAKAHARFFPYLKRNSLTSKKIKKIFKILLLLAFNASACMAADYHFSTSIGLDSRSAAQAQNPDTPWKSIDKLNEIFRS